MAPYRQEAVPMPNAKTVADKLLVAAFELEDSGCRPFSAEDLVVAAWERFPATFGLIGYADDSGRLKYPDSNRVFSEVMGSKPLRKRGLLKKVGKKRYQLTESGSNLAAHLKADSDPNGRPSTGQKAGLSRATQVQLRRLLGSKAWRKYTDAGMDSITFHDACGFWGITPHSSANQLASRVTNIEGMIEEAQSLAQGGTLTFGHGGDAFTGTQLDKLRELNDRLLTQFDDSLSIIRKRVDERKT